MRQRYNLLLPGRVFSSPNHTVAPAVQLAQQLFKRLDAWGQHTATAGMKVASITVDTATHAAEAPTRAKEPSGQLQSPEPSATNPAAAALPQLYSRIRSHNLQ